MPNHQLSVGRMITSMQTAGYSLQVKYKEELTTTKENGTNVSLPGDKDRVNYGSEQVGLNVSQRSSEAEPRCCSDKHTVKLARNYRYLGLCHQAMRR